MMPALLVGWLVDECLSKGEGPLLHLRPGLDPLRNAVWRLSAALLLVKPHQLRCTHPLLPTTSVAELSSQPPDPSPPAFTCSELAQRCQLLQINMMHLLARLREFEALARLEAASATAAWVDAKAPAANGGNMEAVRGGVQQPAANGAAGMGTEDDEL